MNDWRNEGIKEWSSEGGKEGMSDWVNEIMNEWVNEWHEWMNEWVSEWLNEWTSHRGCAFCRLRWHVLHSASQKCFDLRNASINCFTRGCGPRSAKVVDKKWTCRTVARARFYIIKIVKNYQSRSSFGRWGRQNVHENVARARFHIKIVISFGLGSHGKCARDCRAGCHRKCFPVNHITMSTTSSSSRSWEVWQLGTRELAFAGTIW